MFGVYHNHTFKLALLELIEANMKLKTSGEVAAYFSMRIRAGELLSYLSMGHW